MFLAENAKNKTDTEPDVRTIKKYDMKMFFTIFLLLVALPVQGYEFIQDYKPEKFNKTLEQAKNNDPVALEEIGKYYQFGIGVKQNTEKALYWYKKAASQGLTSVKKDIGDIYQKNKNYKDSYKWYYLAALDNLYPAQEILKKVEIELTKEEIKESKHSAFEWLKRNAENGDPFSQFHLGKVYSSNEVVEQDNVLALKWILLGQSYFSLISSYNPYVDNSEENKIQEDIMKSMSQEEINQSKELAKAWIEKRKSKK